VLSGQLRQTERMIAVTLTPFTRGDLPTLAGWLAAPHVARYWPRPAGLAEVTEHYGPAIDGDNPTALLLIRAAGRAVGLIQWYLVRDYPEWARTLRPCQVDTATGAGLDYLIGEADALRQGIGSAAITACAARCFAVPGVNQVAAAPQQANIGSWRALERAGFTRRWFGRLDTDDPADAGPAFVYALDRPPSVSPGVPPEHNV